MPVNYVKTPFPWFGGKSDAAPAVWSALGDPAHYVEPFAGSLAVLLRRPHVCNRAYHSETVNDFDGLLVNAWRSMQISPDATAEAASWPVSEADLHARHLALLKWRAENQLEHLMGDPHFHDPVMAGWWMWGQSSWIGSGWCSGEGPWVVGDDGRIKKREKPGVHRKLPFLSANGRGVNHANLREEGVGVSRRLPCLSHDGQGVNRPQLREEGVGVSRKLPHIVGNGQGVNRSQLREEGVGVSRQLPFLSGGQGVNRPQLREEGVGEYHPMTMPELRCWMQFLSARLRHVRILNGDWSRACTNGAMKTIPVRQGTGVCGVFLDPPYADTSDRAKVYAKDDFQIAHEVREWALANGNDPQLRIVMAGYDGEHGGAFEAAGWTAVEWYRDGFLRGGMGNVAGTGAHQQHRERLWLSPHCLQPHAQPMQTGLFT